jgi:hypothetical protein
MYRGNVASPFAAAGKQWEAVLVFGACALSPSQAIGGTGVALLAGRGELRKCESLLTKV